MLRNSVLFQIEKTLLQYNKMMSTVSVELKQGTVIGNKEKLPNGQPMYSFKGLPYAKPPVGRLRFMSPVALEKFDQPVLDCTKERDVCFQQHIFTRQIIGSENCLFLNVYTPKLVSAKSTRLPVMVWIHGGAFLSDSGNADLYSPEYMVQENVIVVTINYRLGTLGFLHLPQAGVNGNAGLKDQLLALKWVNSNIERFNGDPQNITLFGESAGAASTHLHMLSENSSKYFHKAICQSGTANMEWVMQRDSEERARRLAKAVGCTATKDTEILEFLQAANAEKMTKKMLSVLTEDDRRRGLPMPFKPVVECPSPDAIVTEDPKHSLMRKDLIQMPLMLGYTSHEGCIMLLDADKKLKIYDSDMARLIPRDVNIPTHSPLAGKLGEEIKKFYFGTKPVCEETRPQLIDVMSDYYFSIALQQCAEMHSLYQTKSPLYLYRFDFDGELNMLKILFGLGEMKGACHGDDMFYLFVMKMAPVEIAEDSRSAQMRRKMCKLWTNFAKYGNPTVPNDQELSVNWKPVEKTTATDTVSSPNLDCLRIADKLSMIKNPDAERMQFWRNIYKTWNPEMRMKPKL